MKHTLVFPITFALFGCTDTNNTESQNTASVEQEIEDVETISLRFDFGQDEEANSWFALNDDVMGGISVGEVSFTDSSLLFEGIVSTSNNGGFVSLRSPNDSYDLSLYTDVIISYRAEGHNFKMILADDPAWYEPRYELEVISESSDWTTARFSLYDFKEYAMTAIGDVETGVDISSDYLSDVLRMEFMNTSFEDGVFDLEIDYIEFQGVLQD